MENLRLVDKPVGFSSFQMVRLLRKKYDKVGHAGTLDPLASGLLIILLNDATKEFRRFESCDKEYSGEIMLGIATDTYDITGRVIARSNRNARPSTEDLQKAADSFVGEIDQRPPGFSALKIHGKRCYALSRQGKQICPAPRRVLVKELAITGSSEDTVRFRTIVGKGVYVRSLANDFGERLGCGATLISLRRMRIGAYHVKDAECLGMLLGTGGR